jgi:hypothetical protein
MMFLHIIIQIFSSIYILLNSFKNIFQNLLTQEYLSTLVPHSFLRHMRPRASVCGCLHVVDVVENRLAAFRLWKTICLDW